MDKSCHLDATEHVCELLLSLTMVDPTGTWGAWSLLETRGQEGSMARHGHTATLLGGRIYCFGGRDSKKAFLDSIHVLDPGTLQWRTPRVKSSSPPPRTFHTADALENSRIVVFGGNGPCESPCNQTETIFFNDTWLFVAERSEWKKSSVAGKPPPPRAAHASVILAGSHAPASKLFVIGGTDGERA